LLLSCSVSVHHSCRKLSIFSCTGYSRRRVTLFQTAVTRSVLHYNTCKIQHRDTECKFAKYLLKKK
jgi:hypothetical protein